LNLSVRVYTVIRFALDLDGNFEGILFRGIVAAYRPCEATDPRDKIYVGLGLLGGQRQEGVLASKPNYDVTAQALYTEFARCWILRRKL
jgi:hypothetical protein